MRAHLICKIHHYKTQGVNEAELMFNDPLNWHPLHEKVYSSASNQKNTLVCLSKHTTKWSINLMNLWKHFYAKLTLHSWQTKPSRSSIHRVSQRDIQTMVAAQPVRKKKFTNQLTHEIIGSFNNHDNNGRKKVTINMNSHFFQTSQLFQLALNVKSGWNFLELNSWRLHPS